VSGPPDPVYENVAAFAAQLVRDGVEDVVVTPGSRSTPLALGLHAQPALRTWIQLDERSAGFFALGLGRAAGVPAVLVCTSGTAVANYLPAMVEAHHAGVPLIACSADRPPELRDFGAGQTIDQVKIFGPVTRWAADLPVAGEVGSDHFRVAAMRAVSAATDGDPGPVHLNWPLREPLEPTGSVRVEAARPVLAAVRDAAPLPDVTDHLADLVTRERGVIVVGPPPGVGLDAELARAEAIDRFAVAVGWPVIGEPLTHARGPGSRRSVVVTTADRLLASGDFAKRMEPEVVVRIGRSPTTKPVRLWLEQHRPERVVLIDPAGHWNEASFTITDHLALEPDIALGGIRSGPRSSGWLESWRTAEARALQAIAEVIDGGPLLSGAVCRILLASLPSGSRLMASNSMPVRELDTFSGPDVAPVVVGNRGASGIDGVGSTALGLAAAHPDRSAALFTGDLALLHDLGGLLAAARLGLHLSVVCIDNDGGGIFAMLPVAGRIPSDDFETLFRTAPQLDLGDLDGLGGIRVRRIEVASELARTIAETMDAREPGVDLMVVPVDRDSDLAQHRAVTDAVAAAVVTDD
jgi:2-succinyl-5-enolpyruvyl-6-hydroxy-3-cyclohexene-1-carboxylate synthase